MRKWFVTLAIFTGSLVPLGADVTIIQTITHERPAGAGGPAATSPQPLPTSTMRIRGMKARSDFDLDGQTITAITDLEQRQVILLDSRTKTVQVVTPESANAGAGGVTVRNIDVSFRGTGKSRVVDGVKCDEHSFTIKLAMVEMGGQAQVPPEAAAMMKDVKMVMNGSVWLAKNVPGAAEFIAFNKLALASGLLPAVSGLVEMKPGQWGGLDKLMAASASAPGLPYLTEVMLTFEGSSQMADVLKQMGSMKMIQKVVSLSTDAVSDDLFKVPEATPSLRHVAHSMSRLPLLKLSTDVRQQRGRFSNARAAGRGTKTVQRFFGNRCRSSPMSQRADFATISPLSSAMDGIDPELAYPGCDRQVQTR